MSQKGHEQPSDARFVSGRSLIRKQTAAETTGNGLDAPLAAVRPEMQRVIDLFDGRLNAIGPRARSSGVVRLATTTHAFRLPPTRLRPRRYRR